jgi:hypothetical protein
MAPETREDLRLPHEMGSHPMQTPSFPVNETCVFPRSEKKAVEALGTPRGWNIGLSRNGIAAATPPFCDTWSHSGLRVGEILFISEETVKVHFKHIMDKLGAKDRTQAIAIAVRRGIIQL